MNRSTSKIFHFFVQLFLYLICFNASAQVSQKRMDSLYLVARDMTDADSSAMMIEKLLKETKANNYKMGTINLVILKGVNLYNSGKFDQTLKVLQEIEPEVREVKNFSSLSHLLALKANCYGNLFYFEKSKEYLLESKHFADKIVDNDKRYASIGRFYRLWALNIQNNTSIPVNLDSVMFYRKRSYYTQLLIANKASRSPLIIEASAIGNLFLDKGKLDSAKHYFQIAQGLTKTLKVDKLGIESLIGLGKIYAKLNNTDSALFYYKRALTFSEKAKRVGNIKICNQLLAALYIKIGDEGKAEQHTAVFSKITDSLARANKVSSQVTADLIIKDKEILHTNNKKSYLLIIALAVVVIIIALVAFILLRKKHSKSIKIHHEEQTLLNKKFDNLQVDKLSENVLKEITGLVKTNDLAFLAKFKEHYPIFIEKIMQHAPDMLSSDLSLCAKLKLGFNTKEIAYYDKSSQRAIESRKYRIRKKLGLTADDDLATWIVKL